MPTLILGRCMHCQRHMLPYIWCATLSDCAGNANESHEQWKRVPQHEQASSFVITCWKHTIIVIHRPPADDLVPVDHKAFT